MNSKVFRLPAGTAFADQLAAGLLERTQGDPLQLADMLVLLPTRRACRTLRQSFLRQSDGRALLLPRLMPLGDLDADELLLTAGTELPPSISPRGRQFLLAKLIRHHGDRNMPTPQLLVLARALGTLLDDFTLEAVEMSQMQTLVTGELAEHWNTTLTFLNPILAGWQRELAQRGLLDPADRRNRLLHAQAAQWQREPPAHPVIAAGSTGSIPATATLLKVVSTLPHGEVILPGLPEAPDWWETIDVTHPLFELKQLLARMEINPADIKLWPHTNNSRGARLELLHHALLPATLTARWAQLPALDSTGLTRIDCAHENEEAAVIALAMRGQLEVKESTAMLVTPDRTLGRRVASCLQRWGIGVDDSAGVPLHKTESATFLRSLLAYAAEPTLLKLLAVMKHPMAALGLPMQECRQRIRALELQTRRELQPARTLKQLLEQSDSDQEWLQTLTEALEPLTALYQRPRIGLDEALAVLIGTAEELASTDQTPGSQRLWRGEPGTALAEWCAEVLAFSESGDLPELTPPELDETLLGLMSDGVVRPRYGEHPRLFILGPMEARLQQADLVILGGLNEGVWPSAPQPDPWLSRPMRKTLGLKTPEERLGQEAHDFYTLAAAPRVILTRALRQEGTPTVPSRWLSRLQTVQRGQSGAEANDWLALARQLDEPTHFASALPPEPTPPLAARPRQLAVTDVEKLLIDPYAIYARKILRLDKLQPLDPEPNAADRGNFYHAVLQTFHQQHKDALPADIFAELQRIGEIKLAELQLADQRTLWWPRFTEVCRWIETEERKRQGRVSPEVKGKLERPDGFIVTAKADRIEKLNNGALAVIDYKTGGIPTQGQIERGLAPQLPLEAAIAQAGGFKDIPAAKVQELAFWQLSGKRGERGKVVLFGKKNINLPQAIDEAVTQLDETIRWYADEKNPYRSEPLGDFVPRYSDVRLLARVKEWSVDEEAEA
jgi:ATP-dependent helicase/nuclease subunit B